MQRGDAESEANAYIHHIIFMNEFSSFHNLFLSLSVSLSLSRSGGYAPFFGCDFIDKSIKITSV